tara:strand:+ start:647 stop:1168 length:522 start_codon:yes stop_codon:yes gene_type:complete
MPDKKNNINQKLFNLQQEIGTISKDTKNPFYKSKYFDINSLIKQLQPLLKKHRLLLLQPIEEDMVYSKLICLDSTGGVVSALKLPEINDPQKLGSAITYYRRYTLASLLALQAVDDDANLASSRVVDKTKSKLTLNSEAYNKAKNYIKNQGGSIENVKVKYIIDKEVEQNLLN